MITYEQKEKLRQKIKVEYKNGQWQIWIDLVGGVSAVGPTIESAIFNFMNGCQDFFNLPDMDWDLFLMQIDPELEKSADELMRQNGLK